MKGTVTKGDRNGRQYWNKLDAEDIGMSQIRKWYWVSTLCIT